MSRLTEINRINREADFIAYRERKLYAIFKWYTLAACVLIGIWFVIDLLLCCDILLQLIILRTIIIISLLANFFVALSNKKKNLRLQLYIGFYIGAISCSMLSVSTASHDYVYWFGLIFLLVTWHLMVPFSYHKLTLHGLSFIIIFNIIMYDLCYSQLHFRPMVQINMIFIVVNLISAIVGYSRNVSDKNDFLNTRIIDKQLADLKYAKTELESVNRQLELVVSKQSEELDKATNQLLELQNKNLQTQFEILKSQVNPHFLFNSLNVLSSLIKFEPDLAEEFTEQLAKVYRYILENKDKDLIPVRTEIDFLDAYVFLLNIRFKDKLIVDISVDNEVMDMYLVPLALQLLLENCIKHNIFSKKSPLHIKIYSDRCCYITISNNIQKREAHFASTGVGLKNIERRYALITDNKPEFKETSQEFIARIPLIETV